MSPALWRNGIYCRADDRGEPVIQLAPPLTIGREEIDEIVKIMRKTLLEANRFLQSMLAEQEAIEAMRVLEEQLKPRAITPPTRARSNSSKKIP